MSVFPQNDKERKNLPVFKMIAHYFPKALREVTRVCVVNNVRYNPDRKPADINWARGKSTDQLGSLFRHILEYEADGLVFEELPPEVQAACGPGFERVYVLAEAAWRALAALELEVEKQEALPCGCPSHHEHGPGGAAACPKCTPKPTVLLCQDSPLPFPPESPVLGCACGNCGRARHNATLRV